MVVFEVKEQSLEHTPNVQHGFFNSWIDHSYSGIGQRRVTLSTTQAALVTSLAIIMLTLSVPSAYLILVRLSAKILSRIFKALSSGRNGKSDPPTLKTTLLEDHEPEPNDETPLLPHRQEGEDVGSQIYQIWVRSTSLQGCVIGLMTLASSQEKKRHDRSSWSHTGVVVLSVLFSLLATASFIVLASLAVFSVNISTDSAVLSRHPDCGIWVRNPKILTPSPTGFDYLQELEAVDYARRCDHASTETDGCNGFLTQRILYSNNSHRQCPFEDSLCLDGRFSAYTLQTGSASFNYTVPSKELGINVRTGYSFRRTSTCSPIQRRATLSSDGQTYEYDYGSSLGFGNLTWTSLANPVWEFTGYNVATFFYKKHAYSQRWQPIPEFKPSDHQSITQLLVQSQKNYHTTPQKDPIFPATESTQPSPGHPPLFFNGDPIATALACVDSTEVCEASGKECFTDIYHPSPELPDESEGVGYYMLLQALVDSSIFQAIQLLGGRALIAESKLERTVSLPLAAEQWKVEAGNLFAASLARSQITLRDYIRGKAAHDPEYSDRTQGGLHGMCQAYKFPGHGWRNVKVWGMVLILAVVYVIWVLAIEVQDPSQRFCASIEAFGHQDFDLNAYEGPQVPKISQQILLAEWILDRLFELMEKESVSESHEIPPEQDEIAS